MKKIIGLLLFIIYTSFSVIYSQNNGDNIVGYYYYFEPKEKEYTQVEVYKSGNKYKGKVIWLKEPYFPDGKVKTDIFNKDKSKRNRP